MEYVTPPGYGMTLRVVEMPPGCGPMGAVGPSTSLLEALAMSAAAAPTLIPAAEPETQTVFVPAPDRRKRRPGFNPLPV